MMNRKGASLSGWTEAGVGLILVLALLAIIVVGMNTKYGQSNDPTFGFSSSTTKSAFENYQGSLQTGMQGEASTNSINGISVTSSWGIIKAGLSMCWDLVNGQWIYNAVMLLQWGDAGVALAWALRLLFIFSIGFVLIKILMKVKP